MSSSKSKEEKMEAVEGVLEGLGLGERGRGRLIKLAAGMPRPKDLLRDSTPVCAVVFGRFLYG